MLPALPFLWATDLHSRGRRRGETGHYTKGHTSGLRETAPGKTRGREQRRERAPARGGGRGRPSPGHSRARDSGPPRPDRSQTPRPGRAPRPPGGRRGQVRAQAPVGAGARPEVGPRDSRVPRAGRTPNAALLPGSDRLSGARARAGGAGPGRAAAPDDAPRRRAGPRLAPAAGPPRVPRRAGEARPPQSPPGPPRAASTYLGGVVPHRDVRAPPRLHGEAHDLPLDEDEQQHEHLSEGGGGRLSKAVTGKRARLGPKAPVGLPGALRGGGGAEGAAASVPAHSGGGSESRPREGAAESAEGGDGGRPRQGPLRGQTRRQDGAGVSSPGSRRPSPARHSPPTASYCRTPWPRPPPHSAPRTAPGHPPPCLVSPGSAEARALGLPEIPRPFPHGERPRLTRSENMADGKPRETFALPLPPNT